MPEREQEIREAIRRGEPISSVDTEDLDTHITDLEARCASMEAVVKEAREALIILACSDEGGARFTAKKLGAALTALDRQRSEDND
jgi:hypothetical protein